MLVLAFLVIWTMSIPSAGLKGKIDDFYYFLSSFPDPLLFSANLEKCIVGSGVEFIFFLSASNKDN